MIFKKIWKLKEYDTDAAEKIKDAVSVLPVTAALLTQRGCYDKKSAVSFINKENAAMHDPFLLPDMKEAVKRIEKAERNNEKIAVYGDYDADGITGTSVLVLFFRELGLDVIYHIPERLTEGYGMNRDAVKALAEKGVDLIVTVDTGITAVEEVKLASDLGVDVIVTDHHECRPELPDAVAVIDPKRPDSKYPFSDLAGVGVAFKLICAYYCYSATGEFEYTQENKDIIFEAIRDCYKNYGDITALGTIADVMPVMNENRLITAYGLNKMKKTKNKGLAALLKATELVTEDSVAKKITSTSVGFILAPRINAAGRLGSAAKAARMFLTDSEDEAEQLADWLCEQNKERQSKELDITAEAEALIRSTVDLQHERIIVLSAETWHHGVIGIVSSRITDKYHLPSILISFDSGDDVGKGSGRSIEDFDLLAAITECSDRLIKYGGHKNAAGLSLKREELDGFKKEICEYAKAHITDDMLTPHVYADAELYPGDINTALTDDISKLEPFGEGNPVPLFMMRNLKITEIIPIKSGKHTRVCFSKDGALLQGMYFGMTTEELEFLPTDTVDILFNVYENEFRGTVSAQIQIKDMRLSDSVINEYESEINVYEYIKDDIILPQKEHIPDREDCAAVFRQLKKHFEKYKNAPLNAHKFLKTEIKGVGYIKFRLILDIFSELGFIAAGDNDGIMFEITLNEVTEKKPLTSSELFSKLNSQS